MATRNEDGTVTLRTRGALAYNPSGAPAVGLTRPAQAKSIGGGGFAQSGRLTPQKGRSTSPKSARV